MGGKREMRRCVSLMEDKHKMSEELSRAGNMKQHVTSFCPITIQIDGCSDDESGNTESRRQNSNHVIKVANQKVKNQRTSSPFQRIYNESPQSSPYNSHRSSPNFLEVPPENSDLSALKATAVRLNLRTRTSSFLEWQSKWLDKSRGPPEFPLPAGADGNEGKLTAERKDKINHALDWLKTELKEMRSMDQHLARQLLSLRHDIHQLRLRRSCQQHRDLLDDVQSELEEQEELSDVLDLIPNGTLNDTPLKQIGVTRMNLCSRRFSMC